MPSAHRRSGDSLGPAAKGTVLKPKTADTICAELAPMNASETTSTTPSPMRRPRRRARRSSSSRSVSPFTAPLIVGAESSVNVLEAAAWPRPFSGDRLRS
jgi:hypothetical protein